MQNRFLDSQPVNFGRINYGEDAGMARAQAVEGAGSMLGNAIMQYAKDKKERDKKKAEDEAAARMLNALGPDAYKIEGEKGRSAEKFNPESK